MTTAYVAIVLGLLVLGLGGLLYGAVIGNLGSTTNAVDCLRASECEAVYVDLVPYAHSNLVWHEGVMEPYVWCLPERSDTKPDTWDEVDRWHATVRNASCRRAPQPLGKASK